MRAAIFAVALLAAMPAMAFTTVDEYQPDFAEARECKDIEGRKVWVGERGYYIQAWLLRSGQSGALDPEVALAVPFADNEPANLVDFKKACE